MKIVFVLALLANIFFFFWEYNSAVPNSSLSYSNNDSPKQILLLSELDDDLTIAANKNLRAYPKPTITEAIESGIELQELNSHEQEIELSDLTVPPLAKDKVIGLKKLMEDDLSSNQLAIENSEILVEKNDLNNSAKIDFKNDRVRRKLVFCYQVGPFEDKDTLDRWSRINNVNKGSLQPFSKYNQDDARYLVYFPAAIDYEISKQNVQFFIDMGIADYWLFKTGNLKGAISLGLFDKAVDALALKEKFFNRGINVEIRESYSNASVLFARVLSIDEDFKETAIMSAEQMVVDCE